MLKVVIYPFCSILFLRLKRLGPAHAPGKRITWKCKYWGGGHRWGSFRSLSTTVHGAGSRGTQHPRPCEAIPPQGPATRWGRSLAPRVCLAHRGDGPECWGAHTSRNRPQSEKAGGSSWIKTQDPEASGLVQHLWRHWAFSCSHSGNCSWKQPLLAIFPAGTTWLALSFTGTS